MPLIRKTSTASTLRTARPKTSAIERNQVRRLGSRVVRLCYTGRDLLGSGGRRERQPFLSLQKSMRWCCARLRDSLPQIVAYSGVI
jgi:hypothetical protein